MVHLPHIVKLEPTKRCRPAGRRRVHVDLRHRHPSGRRLPHLHPGRHVDRSRARVRDLRRGLVEGRTAKGEPAQRVEFTLRWPDKLPLRLAATSGPVKDGFADVEMRVTNAWDVHDGRVLADGHVPEGPHRGLAPVRRQRPDGRRRLRDLPFGPAEARATDRFTVRMKVTATPVTVPLFLAPTNRYTNKDSKLDLTLKAATAGAPGDDNNAGTDPARHRQPDHTDPDRNRCGPGRGGRRHPAGVAPPPLRHRLSV